MSEIQRQRTSKKMKGWSSQRIGSLRALEKTEDGLVASEMRKFSKMKMEKTGDGLAALEMPERQRQRRSREMKTEKREGGFGDAGEMKTKEEMRVPCER